MKLVSAADVLHKRKLYEQMLAEANVANIKLPIGSELTIQAYLTKYAEGLATPEVKNAFIKKLATFLINDERNLHALREVPQDAPDWAKQAALAGQLTVFKPDAALNDKVQHIVHYLAAAEQDAAKPVNRDQQIFAQRELQGFGKAENLDLLAKKSNEYFSRGARSQKREASGMEQTFDVGDGYVWYELQSAEAFAREGKLLQNCIGSHYTPAKCQTEHMLIFILRDPKDNTVAACRVKQDGDTWALQELKGKQNQPPADKYMKPAIAFLNKMKFTIGGYAMNDLKNAGYFYVEGEFYDLPTAIKKFTHVTPIGKVSSGEIYQVSGNTDLMEHAYPYLERGAIVYELRDDQGNPNFCFYVRNETIERVKSSAARSDEENDYKFRHMVVSGKIDPNVRNEVFNFLKAKGLVKGVTAEIGKRLFWKEKTMYNDETKTFGAAKVDKEHQTDQTHNKWDEYNSPDTINEIRRIIKPDVTNNYSKVESELLPKRGDIKQVYVMHGNKESKFVFLVNKDDVAIPGVVEDGNFSFDRNSFGYAGENSWNRTERIDKDIDSLIAFANSKNLEIPTKVCESHGIINENGKYKRFKLEPKQVMDTPKVTEYSFGNLKDVNKATALKFAADELELKSGNDKRFGSPVFAGLEENISAFYVVDITYGVDKPHKFILACAGKEIMHIDDRSKRQSWQGWDDYDNIAKTINEVKTKLGLSLSPDATKDSKEFKIVNGDLSTKSHDIHQRLERKKQRGMASTEGVDELTYADGSKLIRIPSGEQAGWMRQTLGSSNIPGEMWKLVKPDGTIPYAYFVNNSKIVRTMMHHYYTSETELPVDKLPTARDFNAESLTYLKTAADTFGWKPHMPKLEIKPDPEADSYKALKKIVDQNARDMVYSTSTLKREPDMQRLLRFGLAQRVRKPGYYSSNTWTHIKPTPAGIAALERLKAGESINGLAAITAKERDPEFRLPEKPEVKDESREHEPRQPRVRLDGGRTKASMAIEKFREMKDQHGRIPTLGEFRRVLMAPPFDMSSLAAQTYYYATKKKVASPIGEGFYTFDFGIKPSSLLRELIR